MHFKMFLTLTGASVGAIIGGVLGGTCGVVLISFAVVYFIKQQTAAAQVGTRGTGDQEMQRVN